MNNDDYNLKYGGRFGEDDSNYYNYIDDNRNVDDVMTVNDWIGTIIILSIPIINIIMYFTWAFSDSVNKNKKNFSRATLILTAIGIVFGVLLSSCTGRY